MSPTAREMPCSKFFTTPRRRSFTTTSTAKRALESISEAMATVASEDASSLTISSSGSRS